MVGLDIIIFSPVAFVSLRTQSDIVGGQFRVWGKVYGPEIGYRAAGRHSSAQKIKDLW